MKKEKSLQRRIVSFIMVSLIIMAFMPSVTFADSTTDGIEQNYKATDGLTDADKKNGAQNNYQKNTDATSGSYIYKTAEWTDKTAGKAKITLTTKQPVDRETTAVYALTTCIVHGFTKEIADANIKYLLANYDHVDVIKCFNTPTIYKDVKEEDIDTILPQSDFDGNRHHNFFVYQGLYDYLMGTTAGSETGNEDQVKFPTCIYTSFDSCPENEIYPASGYQYDCWDIIKRYNTQGRYFSMANSTGGGTNFLSFEGVGIINVLPIGLINAVVGLMDPTLFPGIDSTTLWDGTTDVKANHYLTPSECMQKYGAVEFGGLRTDVQADYKYSDTFEAFDVPIVSNLQLKDEIADEFTVTTATSDNENVTTTVNGNIVSASVQDYDGTTPVTVTIEIELKDLENQDKWDKWIDTNKGNATTTVIKDGNTVSTSVASPKLCYTKQEKYTITTSVTGGTIDSSAEADKGDDKTINYQPNTGYKLKAVKVDGVNVDITQYPSSYTFTDLAENHTIEVTFEVDSSTPDVPGQPDGHKTDVPDVPETGDSNNTVGLLILMLASLAGLMTTVFVKRRDN